MFSVLRFSWFALACSKLSNWCLVRSYDEKFRTVEHESCSPRFSGAEISSITGKDWKANDACSVLQPSVSLLSRFRFR